MLNHVEVSLMLEIPRPAKRGEGGAQRRVRGRPSSALRAPSPRSRGAKGLNAQSRRSFVDARDPSPREAGRGWRAAPGEGPPFIRPSGTFSPLTRGEGP